MASAGYETLIGSFTHLPSIFGGVTKGFSKKHFCDESKTGIFEFDRKINPYFADFPGARTIKQKPFFAYLHFYSTHYPHNISDEVPGYPDDTAYDREIRHLDQVMGESYKLLKDAGILVKTVIV